MGFEITASNLGESEMYIAQELQDKGAFQGWEDFQRDFGYIGT